MDRRGVIAVMVLLVAVMSSFILMADDVPAEVTSGTCGDDLTWEFDSDTGKLTISGTGPMWDYSYSTWRNLDVKDAVFEGSPTHIGGKAFFLIESLRSVTIPSTVRSIGDTAFMGCKSLLSISLEEGLESIGRGAFTMCNSLQSVTIPSTVTSLESSMFFSCTSLQSVTLQEGLATIGSNAFSFCSSLTSLTIPSTVTSIGDKALYDCTSLLEIKVSEDNDIFSSVDGVLFNKGKTELIKYPGGKTTEIYTITENVTSLGNEAFVDGALCSKFKVVAENGNFIVIDGVLFNNDGKVLLRYPGGKAGEYTIPIGVESIGDNAFSRSLSLSSVTIPSNVLSIGDDAFHDCSGLSSVTSASGVTSVGASAFSGCPVTHLDVDSDEVLRSVPKGSKLKTLTVRTSISTISAEMFTSTSNLEEFVVIGNPDFSSINGVLFNGDGTEIIKCPQGKIGAYVISANVTSIGSRAFDGCTMINSITIPSTVTSIGADAFYQCSFTAFDVDSDVALNSVPKGYRVKTVTIGDNVKIIDGDTFKDCTGVTAFHVSEENTEFSSIDGVLFTKDTKTLIRYTGGVIGPYVIPAGVEHLGNYAFYDPNYLPSITLPSGLISIGDYAFYGCQSLPSIDLPPTVTNIGDNAFRYCTKITTMTLPDGLETIGVYTFYHCNSLESVIIPSTVTSIGRCAFQYCSSLKSITIPPAVRSIGEYAFERCISLVKIELRSEPDNIGWKAFTLGNEKNKVVCDVYAPSRCIPYNSTDSYTQLRYILPEGDEPDTDKYVAVAVVAAFILLVAALAIFYRKKHG